MKVSPVVFLNGARQAGESTLVQNLLAEHGNVPNLPTTYISLDRAVQMAAAAAAPEAFLTAQKNGLIIDEVQMVPELFSCVKSGSR